jgi:hypothetical protein
MPNDLGRYPRYRFPPAIISHAVWLYYRFTLSFRDVEDLLAHRGITRTNPFGTGARPSASPTPGDSGIGPGPSATPGISTNSS